MVLACLGRLAESDRVPNTPRLVFEEQGLAGGSEDKAGANKKGGWLQTGVVSPKLDAYQSLLEFEEIFGICKVIRKV
jgi:hypothetical protein